MLAPSLSRAGMPPAIPSDKARPVVTDESVAMIVPVR